MKPLTKFAKQIIIATTLIITAQTSYASQQAHQESEYTYNTPNGVLKFVFENGKQGIPADAVMMGNTKLLDSPAPKNENEEWMHFMPSFFGEEHIKPNSNKQQENDFVYRMIVEIGGDGNCIRQFRVIDFTKSKPYVSQPFGYNPNNSYCLKFKNVKWGKDISYIYLEDGEKYAYHTGGDVIGPLE